MCRLIKSGRKWLLFLAAFLALSLPAFGHGGGTDSKGGHNNRKTGDYHYHKKPAQPKQIPAQRYKAVRDTERSSRLNDYFRNGNQGVIHYRGDATKRDVSGSQRKRILTRDGGRCIICRSTYNLEVDHTRALMNGGDNTAGNLATLCHDCHVAKTKMDNSLTRQRERLSKEAT